MNKDYGLKNEPEYQYRGLRARIAEGIKSLRDEGEETKQLIAKSLPMIPVTGGNSRDKFNNNKSIKKF